MDIDIAPYIKELLYKHNNLVIPGFGNFVLTYASTTVDHVQGLLNPPSKTIAFDNNLITNDGKLVEYIKEKHQLSATDATAIINTFVSKTKAQLGSREMVTIQEVGRLYKDFENNIQFIPDTTNFNKASFGLPTINFYPILREPTAASTKSKTKQPISQPTKKTTTKTSTTYKEEQKGWWGYLMSNSWIPISALLLLLAGLGTYIVYPMLTPDKTALAESRINQRPTRVDNEIDNASEDPREDLIDLQMEEEAIAAAQQEEMIDTESITVNPNQKECIVSIGVYGVKENAAALIKQVYDKGYDAYRENYSRNGKNLTKVGIQFGYETEEEFDRKIRNIKRDFPTAVVIKQ